MSEKTGILTVYVLGTTNQVLPVTLIGAQVKIYDASETTESTASQSGRRASPSRAKCVATGITGANGL